MVAMFELARNKELEKFKHRQLSKAAEVAKGKAKLGVIDIQNGLRDCIQAAAFLLNFFVEAVLKDRQIAFAEEMAELSRVLKLQNELDALTRELKLKEESYLQLKEAHSDLKGKMC